MDTKGHVLPVGVKGEICIGGMGVAKGYCNDEEKTNQALTVRNMRIELQMGRKVSKCFKGFSRFGFIEFETYFQMPWIRRIEELETASSHTYTTCFGSKSTGIPHLKEVLDTQRS